MKSFPLLYVIAATCLLLAGCGRNWQPEGVRLPQSSTGIKLSGALRGIKVIYINRHGVSFDGSKVISFVKFYEFMKSKWELEAKEGDKIIKNSYRDDYIACDLEVKASDVWEVLNTIAGFAHSSGIYLVTAKDRDFYTREIPFDFPEHPLRVMCDPTGLIQVEVEKKAMVPINDSRINWNQGAVLYSAHNMNYGQLIRTWDLVVQKGCKSVTIGRGEISN